MNDLIFAHVHQSQVSFSLTLFLLTLVGDLPIHIISRSIYYSAFSLNLNVALKILQNTPTNLINNVNVVGETPLSLVLQSMNYYFP